MKEGPLRSLTFGLAALIAIGCGPGGGKPDAADASPEGASDMAVRDGGDGDRDQGGEVAAKVRDIGKPTNTSASESGLLAVK